MAWDIIRARLVTAIYGHLFPGFGALASAAAQAAATFHRFGVTLGKAGPVPPTTPEGESTAGRVA